MPCCATIGVAACQRNADAAALFGKSVLLYSVGRLDDAQANAERAQAIFERCGAGVEQAYCLQHLGLIAFKRGRLDKAVQLKEQASSLFDRHRTDDDSESQYLFAASLCCLAASLSALGRHSEALVAARRALAVATDAHARVSMPLRCLGEVFADQGALDEAVAHLERSIAAGERGSLEVAETIDALAVVKMLKGEAMQAKALFEAALEYECEPRDLAWKQTVLQKIALLNEAITDGADVAALATSWRAHRTDQG